MKIKSILLFFVLAITALDLFAQPVPSDPSGDPHVPISGIEILIGVGGALGIRKLVIASRKKSSEK